MAKKVLPIHLEQRDREILRIASEEMGISMAEVIRRQIRKLPFGEVLDGKMIIERPAGA